MLLRESLGNMNCRTTMIAHISAAAGNYAETLSTIQIASRVLRMKKKKTKVRSAQLRTGRYSQGASRRPRSPVGQACVLPWAHPKEDCKLPVHLAPHPPCFQEALSGCWVCHVLPGSFG